MSDIDIQKLRNRKLYLHQTEMGIVKIGISDKPAEKSP